MNDTQVINYLENGKNLSKKSENNHDVLKSQIKSYLKIIEDNYVPASVEYERLNYSPKTDAELELKANELGEMDYLKKSAEATALYNAENKMYEDKKENVLKEQAIEGNKIIASYVDDQQKSKNKAIKNGISRSSILGGMYKEIDDKKNLDLEKNAVKYNDSVISIQSQIDALKGEYDTAMQALNVGKAVDIKNKLDELKLLEEKRYQDIVKYNNQMEKNEAEFVLTRKKLEETAKPLRDSANNAIYDKTLAYFYKLPKEQALKELEEDEELKELLGSRYKVIYGQMQQRAN